MLCQASAELILVLISDHCQVVSLVLERDGGSVNPVLPDTLTVRMPSPAGSPTRNSCPDISMSKSFGLKPRDYSFVSDGNEHILVTKAA